MNKIAQRLACADFTFPLLSHEQSLDLIASLGFVAVDIGLFKNRGHLEPARELKNVAGAAKKLRQKLTRRGLQLADIFLIPGESFAEMAPNHPDRGVRLRAREQFRRVVEYTLISGGRHISALPGVCWKEESTAVSFSRSVEELAWRADYARAHGAIYSVEPHIGSIVQHPLKAERLVLATPGLTLTLDYAHFTRHGIPDEEIEPLLKYASHFHCRGGRKKHLQSSFLTNTIDYRRIVKTMNACGYLGYITLEYVWSEWERCNETDNLSETILFKNFLSNLS
jgi:sugar phosphate isomerase/epimerase